MNRKQVTTEIARCIREANTLRENNDHGQQDRRIAQLNNHRVGLVRRLDELKRGQ